jgi:hypothetical protein
MAGRITQEPVEVSALPTSAALRLTQLPVEVSALPSTAALRLTQLVIEVSLSEPGGQPFEEDGFMVLADRFF